MNTLKPSLVVFPFDAFDIRSYRTPGNILLTANDIQALWKERGPKAWVLWPVSMLFGVVAGVRRLLYRHGWLSTYRASVPVIVVGNITVGGSGKSPLVVALAHHLKDAGYRVGIVCRGYKADDSVKVPLEVDASTPTHLAGDEAVMIAQATDCPVVVDKKRSAAIAYLLKQNKIDVVLSDDGLQHYAMQRDIEIVVVSEFAGFGNGFLLPAGPLREPKSRLSTVDFVVRSSSEANAQTDPAHAIADIKHADGLPVVDGQKVFAYSLQLHELVRLDEQRRVPIADLRNNGVMTLLADPSQRSQVSDVDNDAPQTKILALAGIANPERFFQTLKASNLDFQPRIHPDHYSYSEHDFNLIDPNETTADELSSTIYIMTEKDAIKCRELSIDKTKAWYCKTTVVLDEKFMGRLLKRLEESVLRDRPSGDSAA